MATLEEMARTLAATLNSPAWRPDFSTDWDVARIVTFASTVRHETLREASEFVANDAARHAILALVDKPPRSAPPADVVRALALFF
jgi:hypothetical protein